MRDEINETNENFHVFSFENIIYVIYNLFRNIFSNKIRKNPFRMLLLSSPIERLLVRETESLPACSKEDVSRLETRRTIVVARNGYSRAKGFTYTFQLGYFWAKFDRKCVMKRQFAQEKALSKQQWRSRWQQQRARPET